MLRQYKKDAPSFAIYRPDGAYLVNGSSELDRTDNEFTGASTFRGVNPATGVVLYYHLPELKKDDEISMEIKDASGATIRSYSSKADEKSDEKEDKSDKKDKKDKDEPMEGEVVDDKEK